VFEIIVLYLADLLESTGYSEPIIKALGTSVKEKKHKKVTKTKMIVTINDYCEFRTFYKL
jgi:hypothetical protein